MNYSVIIGVHAGFRNLQTIRAAIKAQTVQPKKVFIWSNAKDFYPKYYLDDEDIFVSSSHNIGCFARFSLAGMCQTPAVMVLDDDTIPGRRWAENCINTMGKLDNHAILGCRGIILRTNGYRPFREAGLYAKNPRIQECDLVGHSWFFMRYHAYHMFEWPPVRWDTGEDMHFSAYAKKNDGIRTYCPPHPAGNRDLWGSTMPQLGKAPGRLHTSRRKGDNFDKRGAVVKDLIKRGWEPLFMEGQNNEGNRG